MHQTEPQNPLPLVYKITDPFDTNTYYVRATVRDSLTGDILLTKNLTDQGSGRFTAQIAAPADPSGLGRHIDITKSVYTDSGYTTKSDAYREEVDYWYIKSTTFFGGGGGGGDSDIDYERIRDMIGEEIDQRLATIIEKLPTETDLTLVYKGLHRIRKALTEIKPAVFNEKPTDLTPVLNKVDNASKAILESLTAIPDLVPIKTSLDPLVEKLGGILTILKSLPGQEDLVEQTKTLIEEIGKIDDNKKIVETLSRYVQDKNFKEKMDEDEDEEKPEPQLNLISPYLKRK